MQRRSNAKIFVRRCTRSPCDPGCGRGTFSGDRRRPLYRRLPGPRPLYPRRNYASMDLDRDPDPGCASADLAQDPDPARSSAGAGSATAPDVQPGKPGLRDALPRDRGEAPRPSAATLSPDVPRGRAASSLRDGSAAPPSCGVRAPFQGKPGERPARAASAPRPNEPRAPSRSSLFPDPGSCLRNVRHARGIPAAAVPAGPDRAAASSPALPAGPSPPSAWIPAARRAPAEPRGGPRSRRAARRSPSRRPSLAPCAYRTSSSTPPSGRPSRSA